MSGQPALHDLVATVYAPTQVLSGADGQLRATGVHGLFHADRRVVSTAIVRIDGHEPEPVAAIAEGPGRTRFVGSARHVDPPLRVDRVRTVRPGELVETIEVAGDARITVEVATGDVPLELIRSGAPPQERTGELTVTVAGELAGRGRVSWSARVDDPRAAVHAAAGPVAWSRPQLTGGDPRLHRWLDRSLDDLASLRLADGDDTYLAAGAPWYLTLFGRDSLWAARMMLPLGTELAGGTLRTLARRQGTRVDRSTAEEPGKIMHELRRADPALAGLRLPAAYYGTIDATPLWISLLHDAWRWGLPDAEVIALLPQLEAALGWLRRDADPDGDGFVEYLDASGQGLANQGWKDSGDAIRFADGRIATAPIALAEVQAYAYAAAHDGAALLDAYGRPGGEAWRAYATELAHRFRARFWVPGHPALALDAAKRPVDSLTSNIGHLLGTGLLSQAEEATVARALSRPAMHNGYGLRTMSADDRGYDPGSYHCGAVWPHDTAIVAAGLARAGFPAQAAALIDGLLAAAEAFDYRIPELYAGDAAARPIPYPSACRPQAWSAAAAVLVLWTLLGLAPDRPAALDGPDGVLSARPLPGAPTAVTGLRFAGRPVTVRGAVVS